MGAVGVKGDLGAGLCESERICENLIAGWACFFGSSRVLSLPIFFCFTKGFFVCFALCDIT
jgi:hypothetical protein